MTENQPQDADAQKVRKIVRNIVTAYYGASTESDELAELIVIGLNANGFVTAHWREVVPEPAGGWPSQHAESVRADEVRRGDWIGWCGRVVLVSNIEPEPRHRFTRGRWLDCQMPDQTFRKLFWRNRETVQRFDLFGDTDQPVPDDPWHCFNCGNDLPCPAHSDGEAT